MNIKKENVEKVKQYILGSQLPSCDAQAIVALLLEEPVKEENTESIEKVDETTIKMTKEVMPV